jgi:hypothetical protein
MKKLASARTGSAAGHSERKTCVELSPLDIGPLKLRRDYKGASGEKNFDRNALARAQGEVQVKVAIKRRRRCLRTASGISRARYAN